MTVEMFARWEAALLYGEKVLPMFKKYYGEKTGAVAALLVRYRTLQYDN